MFWFWNWRWGWDWRWGGWFDGSADWAATDADAGDADELAAIHVANFARGWDVAEMDDLLSGREIVASKLVREGRAKPFGFAISRVSGDEAEVLSVAVVEARRGSGGGQVLMARHLGRLAGLGVRRVVLEVDEQNAPAIALYARFGFVEVGRRKAYYERRDGTRGTAKVMALEMR